MSEYGDGPSFGGVGLVILGIVALIFFFGLLWGGCEGLESPEAGKVGVVRNGGPFDNKQIKDIIQPGSGLTFTGLFSDTHYYPAADVQRFYTITADPNRGDVEGGLATLPTKDGVQVGIEGTFQLKFVGQSDEELLKKFDEQFGTRTFGGKHPYEGDEGWENFLDAQLRPVVDNNLRDEIGRFECAELISSCGLIQAGQKGNAVLDDEALKKGAESNANLAAIQESIEESLRDDIVNTLGGEYFREIHFRLAKVTLPEEVQAAINVAQARFAEVTQAKAEVEKARFQNEANRELAKTLQTSPELAQIKAIEALPEGANIFFGFKSPPVVAGR